MLTMKWTFDIKPDDVFWCTADIGWVTGHTYITYGPLACGATEIVFEGVPTYPDAGRFWKMIQEHKVTIFYTAPTAIRSLIKACGGDLHPSQTSTTCPACASWARWASRSTRKPGCGTTTGGRRALPDRRHLLADRDRWHMITPLPGATPLAGLVHAAVAGHHAAIVDETGARPCRTGRAASWSSRSPGPR
jgi:acetyl-CoA synthetase